MIASSKWGLCHVAVIFFLETDERNSDAVYFFNIQFKEQKKGVRYKKIDNSLIDYASEFYYFRSKSDETFLSNLPKKYQTRFNKNFFRCLFFIRKASYYSATQFSDPSNCPVSIELEGNKRLPAKVVNGRKLVFLGNNPLISNRNILLNKLYPKKVYDEETGTYKKEYAGYTVGKFIQQHQFGTYIILVAKHALAVRNGVLIDNVNHDDDLLQNHLRDQRRCMQIFKVKKA